MHFRCINGLRSALRRRQLDWQTLAGRRDALDGQGLVKQAHAQKMAQSMFSPKRLPNNFFPVIGRKMMVRPVQLRANAEDAAFMVRAAQTISSRNGELVLPVTLIAAEDDAVVDPQAHSVRLHEELPHSELYVVPGVGHMAHYAAQDRAVNAIDAPLHAVSLDQFTRMTKDDLTLGTEPELGRR